MHIAHEEASLISKMEFFAKIANFRRKLFLSGRLLYGREIEPRLKFQLFKP